MSTPHTPAAPGNGTNAARARVLVVDDEEALAQVIEYALSAKSDVVITNSGLQARDLLSKDTEFEVIFCDLMMPDMNGMALFAHLSQHQPELTERMVFMSGGAFTAEAAAFLAKIPRERIIEKPFSLKTVRDILEARLQAKRPASGSSPEARAESRVAAG